MAPMVIKVAGRAKRANLNGETIYREDEIFVPSYRQWFKQLDTHNHFCYYIRDQRYSGATMQCSCGSQAAIFHYDAYVNFQSTYLGDVIACVSLMNYRKHADGSTE